MSAKTAITISQANDTATTLKKRPFTSQTEKLSSKPSTPPSPSNNPKQRIRYNNSQPSPRKSNSLNYNNNNKDDSSQNASPTPSDKTDSERRSPSSVMLLSPGEASEQQGSIEQAIKSIEEQIKAEQNRISRNILRKQQKQIKYKIDNQSSAAATAVNNESATTTNDNDNKDSSVKVKSLSTSSSTSTKQSTTKTTKRAQTAPSPSSSSLLSPSSSSSSTTAKRRTCTCGDPKNNWCFVCEVRRFKSDFLKWTSGNKIIDNFIREIQLFSSSEVNYLEWIPYDRLKEVKFIGDGTYSSLSTAVWLDGPRNFLPDGKNYYNNVSSKSSNNINKKIMRDSKKRVILKQLYNSNDITESYLNELSKYYKKILWNNSIMQIYGISKDPSTKNFIIVYENVEQGDLFNYLYENSLNMGWSLKLALICDISKSLKTLHGANLIHRDIHSGNILILQDGSTALTDFGICKHIDNKKKPESGKVEGVLPFMAPEVIKKQTYSKKSDIYSFAMLMWEVSANGKRPFNDRAHDSELALEICQGLRPNHITGTPPCWIKLMEECWDDNPEKRPDADTLHRTLFDWLKKLVETPKLPYSVNTEFSLAENWRIRGQHQQPTNTTIITTNTTITNTTTRPSDNDTAPIENMDEEGGMKVDPSLVSTGSPVSPVSLGNGEFQHPMAFYTSQLFDFSELDFEKPIEKNLETESQEGSSSHEGESNNEMAIVEQKEIPAIPAIPDIPDIPVILDMPVISSKSVIPAIPAIPIVTTPPPLEKLTINTFKNITPEEEKEEMEAIDSLPHSEEKMEAMDSLPYSEEKMEAIDSEEGGSPPPPLEKLTINTFRSITPEEEEETEPSDSLPHSEEGGSPPTTPSSESDENVKNLSESKITDNPEYSIEIEF